MLKKRGYEYYLVNNLDISEKVRPSQLKCGVIVTNIAHMYSKMILLPYEYKNVFVFKPSMIMKELTDLSMDYFELIMLTMKPKDIEQYGKHIGLIKIWMKLK